MKNIIFIFMAIILIGCKGCDLFAQDHEYEIVWDCNDNSDPDHVPTHDYILFVNNIPDTSANIFKNYPVDPMITWAPYLVATVLHVNNCDSLVVPYITKDNGSWITAVVYARASDGRYSPKSDIAYYHKPDLRTVQQASFIRIRRK